MNEATGSGPETLGASTVRALERTCDRFEAAWQSGRPPRIEDELPVAEGPARLILLRELIALDLAYRRRAGERPAPAEYHARFPADPEAVVQAFGALEAEADARPGRTAAADDPARSLPDIPGYAVVGELGRGGMGVVFKAMAEPLRRFVALKMILSGDLAGPEAAARFRAEAEAVAKLQHPQVVQIFRIGDHEGRPFLEMEYVEGGSLARRLDGRPWTPIAAARLVESLADAVRHAHARGIVHRDLKPANILLAADGTPKVTDFGLAKLLAADAGLTRTDSIVGSPSYMAPEQAGGAGHKVGPATDVYSLGAILYELLTGRPPFRAATVLDTLVQVRSADPAPPSRIQPGLPIDIETIALKCLEKEPARRYSGAEAMADDLRRFREGRPIVARPVGIVGRGIKWARRRPLTAALTTFSAAATALLVVGLAVFDVLVAQKQQVTAAALDRERWFHEELARANTLLAEQRAKTREALEVEAIAPAKAGEGLHRGRREAYNRRIALAIAARGAGDSKRADEVLDTCPVDLRGWEWGHLKRTPPAPPVALRGHAGEVWDVAFSPDGRKAATASFDRTLKLWDVATGRLERTFDGHTDRIYTVAFDREGTHLVSASADRTAIIWDVATGEPAHVLRGHTDNVRCATFAAGGQVALTGSWDGTVRMWAIDSGWSIGTYSGLNGRITRVAVNPANGWIATSGTSGKAEVWSHNRGPMQSFQTGTEATLSVAFSPDGWRVAASGNASGIGVVKVWEVASGREILSYTVGSGQIERVVFSPDGRRLVTSGWDGTVRLADASSGHELLVLRGHSDRVWGVNFNARGDMIASASADGNVLLWGASDQGSGADDESGRRPSS